MKRCHAARGTSRPAIERGPATLLPAIHDDQLRPSKARCRITARIPPRRFLSRHNVDLRAPNCMSHNSRSSLLPRFPPSQRTVQRTTMPEIVRNPRKLRWRGYDSAKARRRSPGMPGVGMSCSVQSMTVAGVKRLARHLSVLYWVSGYGCSFKSQEPGQR